MDDLSFYKSLYDRELGRRKDLEDAINIPVATVSILVGLLSFLISNNDFKIKTWEDYTIITLVVLSGLQILAAILFIAKSYNNFFKGFDYLSFALPSEIRKFQVVELPQYNNQVEEDKKLNFEYEIIDRLNSFTDNHKVINDQRGRDLHKAKALVIGAMFLTLTGIGIYSTQQEIFAMSNNDKRPSEAPKPAQPQPTPPRFPSDRIEKGEQPKKIIIRRDESSRSA